MLIIARSTMSDCELITQLRNLIRGLWLPSETEAPWTLPSWTLTSLDIDAIRQALRRQPNAHVTEIALDTFIDQVERRCQGYGDEGQAIAAQHQALANYLQQYCQSVQVFRIGRVTVDILIVGTTTDGYVVLQTQSVET